MHRRWVQHGTRQAHVCRRCVVTWTWASTLQRGLHQWSSISPPVTQVRWQSQQADLVEMQEEVSLQELQDIVNSIDGPCEGSDLADLYQQFLAVHVPQERLRPVLKQLALKWAGKVQNLTPQQLCSIYAVHYRLNCFTKEAFRSLGKQLLFMDPSKFEIEDVVEVLSVNMKYMDNLQALEIGKSYLWDMVLRRHRGHWGTSPIVQVMLKRAEDIPSEEFDVQETLGLLDVMVSMQIQRPKLLDKLLRRVSDLQDEIEGREAVKYFRLVAQCPEHSEGSVEAVKWLLQKTEEYVQQIHDAEERLRLLKELGTSANPDLAYDRRVEVMEQRKAARLAAQEVTNMALAVAEGMVQYTPHLNAEDRRRKAALCNRVAKAAQLQGIALQTDADKFVGPPFMVQEVIGTLLGLGRAAEIGVEFGDPVLANITSSHQSLVEFAMERAKQIPSELYTPHDLIHLMKAQNMLMWRDEDLIHKIAEQATSTDFMFSPLQVNDIIQGIERMKVLNPAFNNCFYMNQYAYYMIDTIIVITIGVVLFALASYIKDRCDDHEADEEVWS